MNRSKTPRANDADEQEPLTFWEHLDVLRGTLIKMLVVIVVAAVVAFCFKEQMFSIILAPKDAHFITYRLLGSDPFSIQLVNIGLTEQFMVHLKAAFWFGFMAASPLIIYYLYGFIAPALYANERKYSVRVISGGYVMFILGILVNYFIIFPMTVRFLGSYSVSASVRNMLSLQSYMDTLLMMSLLFGIIFELPVVSWLMAALGILKAEWMTRYRRHAYVGIMILAALVTPTSDAFTMLVVSLPIGLLYELSILLVWRAEKKHYHTQTLSKLC